MDGCSQMVFCTHLSDTADREGEREGERGGGDIGLRKEEGKTKRSIY